MIWSVNSIFLQVKRKRLMRIKTQYCKFHRLSHTRQKRKNLTLRKGIRHNVYIAWICCFFSFYQTKWHQLFSAQLSQWGFFALQWYLPNRTIRLLASFLRFSGKNFSICKEVSSGLFVWTMSNLFKTLCTCVSTATVAFSKITASTTFAVFIPIPANCTNSDSSSGIKNPHCFCWAYSWEVRFCFSFFWLSSMSWYESFWRYFALFL